TRDVDLAHVDLARKPEERARSRRRHAVLSRARLGDDAGLAHLLREQALPERVVDLVRARVTEVLALQPERRDALALRIERARESIRSRERSRPADVRGEDRAPLLLKGRSARD